MRLLGFWHLFEGLGSWDLSWGAAWEQSPGDGTRTQAPSAIKVGFDIRSTLTWLKARTVGPDSRGVTPGTFLDDIR